MHLDIRHKPWAWESKFSQFSTVKILFDCSRKWLTDLLLDRIVSSCLCLVMQGFLPTLLLKTTFNRNHSLVSVGLLRFCCNTTHRLFHLLLCPSSCLRLQRGGSCCSWLSCCTWCSWSWDCYMSSNSLFHPGQRSSRGEPMSHQVGC